MNTEIDWDEVYQWVDRKNVERKRDGKRRVGWRTVARHFGIPGGEVRWALEKREKDREEARKPVTPPPPPPDKSYADMDRGEFLRVMIDQLAVDMGRMRESGSHQALASAIRQLRDLRDKYDAWREQEQEDFDGGSPDEVAAVALDLMSIPSVRRIVLDRLGVTNG